MTKCNGIWNKKKALDKTKEIRMKFHVIMTYLFRFISFEEGTILI